MSSRTTRFAAFAALLAILAASLAAFAFRDELRYGRVAPPAVDLDALEPTLAARLRERIAAVEAAPYSGEAWGMLGVAFEVHELFPEGIACYERAVELDPREFRWPYFLGLCTRLGDPEASFAHLRRAAELDPNYAPAAFFVGEALMRKEDLDGARAAFTRALELDSSLPAAYLGLARIAIARGDAPSSFRHLQDAQTHSPRTNEIHALYADAYRLAGNAAQAEEHAKRLSDKPEFEQVLDRIRFDLLWNERITLVWRRARAERYVADGRTELAVDELRGCVRDAPEWSPAREALGQLLFRLGRIEEATEAFERAVQLAPANSEAHHGLGRCRARAGNREEAAKCFERALEADPNAHAARNDLGVVLRELGNPARAAEVFAEACRRLPNDVDAHAALAEALAAAGKRDEAIEAYRRVLALDPTRARTHFELGLALAAARRFDEAAAEFRAVLAAEPTRAVAAVNLVLALDAAARDAECAEACRAGLLIAPEDPTLQGTLAWILCTSDDDSLRNGAEALEIATRMTERESDSPQSLRLRAAACAETGDFELAVQLARLALERVDRARTSPSRLAEFERALALYEQRQPFRRAN